MSEIKKVTFDSLPPCADSPNIVLGVNEEIPIALPADERNSLPTAEAMFAMARRAGDIAELAEGAKILGFSEVLVLRVLHPKVEWGPVDSGFFEVLNESGDSLVCLADPGTGEYEKAPDLLTEFVTSVLPMHVNLRTPISRLVAYMVAARDLGLDTDVHRPFAQAGDVDLADGPRGAPHEALQVSRMLARDCPSTRHLGGFLQDMHNWLDAKGMTGLTTAQLLQDLRTEDRFEIWRKTVA